MIPNDDQAKALEAILGWFTFEPSEPFVLGGLAGTGKTALLPMLYDAFDVVPRIRFVCPTWKAAHVLTKKLKDAGIHNPATSIHRLIYNPRGILHEEGCDMWDPLKLRCTLKCKRLAWEYDPKEMPQLLVVDEASMVEPMYRRDLEALGCPVLYVGDHGQLPPVNGKNIFQERAPDHVLEAIQRQAEDSPIIPFSRVVRSGARDWLYQARERGFPVYQAGSGDNRYDPKLADPPHSSPDTVFIAGTNAGVDRLNSLVRKVLGRGPADLVPGELVMAQNNTKKLGIFNGQQGVIQEVTNRYVSLAMETGVMYTGPIFLKGIDEDIPDRADIPVLRHSYALTCHKAQGSEFDNVIIYVANSRPETTEWLYTAVTRAKRQLTFVKAG